jgi:hypothetical protein
MAAIFVHNKNPGAASAPRRTLCLWHAICLPTLACHRAAAPPFDKLKFASPPNKLMKFGVIVFPGSNCDHDAFYAASENLGQPTEYIWHDSRSLGQVDAVILPGGFAYGDYLRCGAIARFSA